ncbi:MAG: hypothetical protein AB1489_43055, partial [Acidobacteriota bacterium]
SIEEGERTLQVEPNITVHAFNSYFYDGQYEKFIVGLPMKEMSYFLFYRGLGYYYLKDRERAATTFDRAYEIKPADLFSQIGKSLSFAIKGERAAGINILRGVEEKLISRGVADGEFIYKVAQAYAVLGEKAAALRLLERSIELGFFCYPYFMRDELLENIRGEAKYLQLMERARERHEAFRRKFFTAYEAK